MLQFCIAMLKIEQNCRTLWTSAIKFAKPIPFWQDPKCRTPRTFYEQKISVSFEKDFIFQFHKHFSASLAFCFLVSYTKLVGWFLSALKH